MRLAVYVDDVYRRDGKGLSAGLTFPLFAAELVSELGAVTMLGRLDPKPGRTHHRMPAEVEFAPLPYYVNLGHPTNVARALLGTGRTFWRVLGRVDAIWLLGPHPLALVAVVLAAARGKRVVLGVRQDTMEYAARRHPDRRSARIVFAGLEWTWRALAKVCPVVVVGPQLVDLYSGAPRLLDLAISFVDDADLLDAQTAAQRDYNGEIRVLSVGRLDPEKNPLLLADVLAALVTAGERIRLVVCGDGPLELDLQKRLSALGVAEHAELLGYRSAEQGLREIYRSSHLFLHVSWTEGVPQVLFEAFAARLPTVATGVGGVRGVAGDAAVIVAPGDADSAAAAVRRVISDQRLRAALTEAGIDRVRTYGRRTQLRRLAVWLREVTKAP